MVETKVSAGDYELNRFLYGGYEKDIITTIYGSGGSGKTNFCMFVAVSQARKGNKVIFIDTEGGFSVERVRQLLGEKQEELEKVLGNILLLKPTSFDEQEKVFEDLNKHLKSQEISLIVVDSIAMLYRLELGDAIESETEGKIQEVNRKMANQLRELNEIARKREIPVVVTNQVYSAFVKNEDLQKKEKKISMVGGDLLKYWSKCLIELSNYNGRRKMILRKHRSLPEKEMSFEIVDGGLKKKGLF